MIVQSHHVVIHDVIVELPFTTTLDDIQLSPELSQAQTLVPAVPACELTATKSNSASAFHHRLIVELDAMLPSVRSDGYFRRTFQQN